MFGESSECLTPDYASPRPFNFQHLVPVKPSERSLFLFLAQAQLHRVERG
jgi:hypothetical protein